MKVAIVNHGLFPFLFGGMERHTTFLANHLCVLGVNVDVLVPEGAQQSDRAIFSDDFHFNIVELPWPKKAMWLHSNYCYSTFVRDHIKSHRYDVVYSQGFNGWAYLTDRDRQKDPPVIYNPHGMEMFKTIGLWQTLKHLPMRAAARIQAKNADLTVSLGGHLTGQVREFFELSDDKIVLLPNAIDLDYINQFLISQDSSHERIENQFVFVGRLAANKGVDYLCSAFSDLTHCHLKIVGDGPLRSELETAYKDCEHIHFVGKIDDEALFGLYQQSDCFVFSSLYEGMPTVILEAMACRLPIIATDIGAVQTMVGDDNGYVVYPSSAESIRDAVISYQNLRKDEKQRLREASFDKVSKSYTWPIIAKQTLDVLKGLLS